MPVIELESIKEKRNFDLYSGLMKNNSYFKEVKCSKEGSCYLCPLWRHSKCEGPKNNKLTRFEKEKLKKRLGEIIMATSPYIEKTQLKKDACLYFHIPEADITTAKLFYYQKRGLIEYQGKKGNPLAKGSVSFYSKNTPGLLYLIEKLQKQGYQLAEIGESLELIKLNDIEKLKVIVEEDETFNNEMFFLIGIDKEIKKYIIKNIPLKLFNFEKILTRLDRLKKVIELRAYAELDYKKLASIMNSNADKIIIKNNIAESIFNDILDYPEIEINLHISKIRVTYSDPVNKKVVFFKDGLIEVS